ncbi:hypothetical protein M885DRAFT_543143 [Pelagophyceae sp. CCMP2097]|nr:hypothetical protein M885DRAFT_543143 [Pelagophyceae sp. CCMP2097]|mmetsp:Transcript_31171/g.109692  ORF Transcript_31171/g.109692 Transcript_31171/m.109692 type:complete len:1194 (+) Transcript_31171:195-3776(+)
MGPRSLALRAVAVLSLLSWSAASDVAADAAVAAGAAVADASVADASVARQLADLALAIGFDLANLPADAPLLRTQLTQSGWLETHAAWVKRAPCDATGREAAPPGAIAVHPVCVGGYALDGGPCGDAVCDVATRPWANDIPSPFYVPVADVVGAGKPLNVFKAEACSLSGSPRVELVNPLDDLSYGVGNLRLSATVTSDGGAVAGALVEIWHADPYGRFSETALRTPLAEAWGEALAEKLQYSSKGACRCAVLADSKGAFVVHTVDPGAYGPPQHFEIRVSKKGYETVVSKVYLDGPSLVNMLAENLLSVRSDQRVFSPTFDSPTLLLNRTLAFEVIMKRTAADLNDFAGLWTNGKGLIEIASNGDILFAAESPTPRSWGSVRAVHSDRFTLQNADFRLGASPSTGSLFRRRGTSAEAVPDYGDKDFIEWSHGERWQRHDRKEAGYRYLRLFVNETLRQHPGGVVQINDVVVHGGIVFGSRRSRHGIRERKALDADATSTAPISSQRLPETARLQCWASTNDADCVKAFDGDAGSFWKSDNVGGWRGKLSTAQSLTLDVGPAETLRPTAISIGCGLAPGNGEANKRQVSNCPRYFELRAARSGADPKEDGNYDVLFAHRVRIVDGEPDETFSSTALGGTQRGGYFAFATGFQGGRPPGARCGSCDSPETGFRCAGEQADRTCSSSWCGGLGVCAALPQCPPGTFLKRKSADDFACVLCEAGKFSAAFTTSEACEDCAAGFYCPAGSVSATALSCPPRGAFCPATSGLPRSVSAGFYALFDAGVVGGGAVGEVECPRGSYCLDGVATPCPAGVYGNQTGLQSKGCTAECAGAGVECAEGSVEPRLCDPGTYCQGNGDASALCPAGRFGAQRGLSTAACSGACRTGNYCPAGSTSADAEQCPAGRFGSTPGLADSSCSGACAPGHFCPANSTKATMRECGLVADAGDGFVVGAYCPSGVGAPMAAEPGYYASGGDGEKTRDSQTACEPGSQCTRGRKSDCPAGRYSVGFSADLDVSFLLEGAAACAACPAGAFCLARSASPAPCPAGRFGGDSLLETAKCSDTCPRGHFCPPGTLLPQACPAGRYGNVTGLTTDACSTACATDGVPNGAPSTICAPALCYAGYYCPASSTHGRALECGEVFFCPPGSAAPTRPAVGLVAVGGETERTHVAEAPCPTCCPNGAAADARLFEPCTPR